MSVGGSRAKPLLKHPHEADQLPVFRVVHDGCCIRVLQN